jgi:hypothetical protein
MYCVWGKNRNAYFVVLGRPDSKRPLVAIGADRRIILKWMLLK